jgi:hypothetical protein
MEEEQNKLVINKWLRKWEDRRRADGKKVGSEVEAARLSCLSSSFHALRSPRRLSPLALLQV